MRRRERMNKVKILKVIGAVLALFSFLTIIWSIAFYVSSSVINALEIRVSPFVTFLISDMVGFVFIVLIWVLIGVLMRPKREAMIWTIIEPIQKIAKGDFSVKIRNEEKYDGEIGVLVKSINDMTDELNAMEKMRQEFVSNVSHEIQSPLTSIKGFARALQDNNLSEEKREHYLTIIETETTRLSKLSQNLLKLTLLESEEYTPERVTYRLDQQLKQIVLNSEPLWAEKEIELDLDLEKVHITADQESMSQVWINLIHNSIKFTPSSGTISIKLKEYETLVEVRIRDTGIGISEEQKQHIFERFYKADSSRNRAYGGSGLGLAIVKKVLDLHQGGIKVESEEGNGTEFIVCILNQEG
ncbi:envelope stress sensor histidine kinase HitS [Bacillus cereus group sp. MYBK71-2]|uniref:envelope stress sensor histidine kinase HitS n=1 Tax=Bacillus cereus group TaxID=86661 RepID=UPI00115C156C|nr:MULTISPECIES: envelope stress sensor histidine kinase HitS [Bacillus cereus group]MCC2337917.1 envelope stress sensor histidine kinase HitS [Bacillus tropicus]MCU5421206.1 envelope stress sensor histidine kinase HitS [Bacillus tropicus]MDA1650648.1 envelope stress sensor histidine kinase HitS [Bacillus cereus group sp. TH160LC]MDA1777837.1 envelope stress sensor histidine kinase HitS [Bacillus cereus group sp. BY9-3LC]MDA1797807.1 envelope stress sensor histidine kinase HitS [Bacillus cereu